MDKRKKIRGIIYGGTAFLILLCVMLVILFHDRSNTYAIELVPTESHWGSRLGYSQKVETDLY